MPMRYICLPVSGSTARGSIRDRTTARSLVGRCPLALHTGEVLARAEPDRVMPRDAAALPTDYANLRTAAADDDDELLARLRAEAHQLRAAPEHRPVTSATPWLA